MKYIINNIPLPISTKVDITTSDYPKDLVGTATIGPLKFTFRSNLGDKVLSQDGDKMYIYGVDIDDVVLVLTKKETDL